jgi:hypothetical protein
MKRLFRDFIEQQFGQSIKLTLSGCKESERFKRLGLEYIGFKK